jgi:hypothetical protein
MKRRILFLFVAAVATLTVVGVAVAGNAHFVGGLSITEGTNSISVSGKVAGLGNISQINVVVSADAACVNPGERKPKAANKSTFSADDDFPVQNGKAEFSLTVTAAFQPNCSGPMTIEFSNVTVAVFDAEGNQLI